MKHRDAVVCIKKPVATKRTVSRRRKATARRHDATALAGLRVLEVSDAKAAYCGKLLADLGADVIKIEPPGGDPGRADPGSFFLYANTNKRSVILDLETRAGRDGFRRLAATADLVVETAAVGEWEARGLGYAALCKLRPSLVWTALSGFGRSGSQASYASSDIVAAALGGSMHVTGEPEDPPVVVVGSQAWIAASTCAAVASLIALHEARRSGRGQLVDVSALEVMAAVTTSAARRSTRGRYQPRRFGSALSLGAWAALRGRPARM
jgi:benzylsuccinate CoA-transferase BbsE subunit